MTFTVRMHAKLLTVLLLQLNQENSAISTIGLMQNEQGTMNMNIQDIFSIMSPVYTPDACHKQ